MSSRTDFGLNTFPLTPLRDDAVDETAFAGLIERLVSAGVDSVTALGSTGSYAYLSTRERAAVARLTVKHAGQVPVVVGVGALRTSDVLANVAHAEEAGAAGVLLAPMTYQPLTPDDVFELYRTVTEHTDLPVIVYDNPGTTHVTFTLDLYRQLADLPGIASIKIPGRPGSIAATTARIAEIRAALPHHVTIGISGDAYAATGLIAGCDGWYSAIGGILPEQAIAITRAAAMGHRDEALAASERLAPIWELFADLGGSLRVIAAIAEQLGLVPAHCLPLPIQGLTGQQRTRVAAALADAGLA